MPGSFNAQTNKYNVLNSNNVAIYIGTVPIAFGASLAVQTAFGARALFGVGSLRPQEIQQLQVLPALTLDTMVLSSGGLQTLGYPSSLLAVLANNKLAITVVDNTGVPLFNYIDCTADNNSIQIAQNSPIAENVSFLARDVLDGNGVSLLGPASLVYVPL